MIIVKKIKQKQTRSLMDEFREYGEEIEFFIKKARYEPLNEEESRRLDWLLDQQDEITGYLNTLRCM